MRAKAEELAAQREEALKDSHVEASKIIDRAKQNGEQQKASIVDSAQSEVMTMKDNAKKTLNNNVKKLCPELKTT